MDEGWICDRCGHGVSWENEICPHCEQGLRPARPGVLVGEGVMRCPKCNRELSAGQEICPYCENLVERKLEKSRKKRFPLVGIIVLGAVAAICIGIVVVVGFLGAWKLWGGIPFGSDEVSSFHRDTDGPGREVESTPTTRGEVTITTRAEATQFPSSTTRPTLRPSATPTPVYVCAGATPFPPQLRPGDQAIVCTSSDNVILRESPNPLSSEIVRYPPGTVVEVVDGPICNESNTWWAIRLYAGTLVRKGSAYAPMYALSSDTLGWSREGSDSVDLVFLCPH